MAENVPGQRIGSTIAAVFGLVHMFVNSEVGAALRGGGRRPDELSVNRSHRARSAGGLYGVSPR
jgi:hypothetical protein